MSSVRNLVNLSGVHKGYATRTVLNEITLGVSAGDRIGVVGRNGEGKSTLLRLIAGVESPDAGVLTRVGDLRMAMLAQGDELREHGTIRGELVGERAEHEWAGDRVFREVLDGLTSFEQAFVIFRQRHARMVERMIGRRTGTGGSAGVDYLDATALLLDMADRERAAGPARLNPLTNGPGRSWRGGW